MKLKDVNDGIITPRVISPREIMPIRGGAEYRGADELKFRALHADRSFCRIVR